MPLVTPASGSGLQGSNGLNGGTGNANQCELLPSGSQAVRRGPRSFWVTFFRIRSGDSSIRALFTEELAFARISRTCILFANVLMPIRL